MNGVLEYSDLWESTRTSHWNQEAHLETVLNEAILVLALCLSVILHFIYSYIRDHMRAVDMEYAQSFTPNKLHICFSPSFTYNLSLGISE